MTVDHAAIAPLLERDDELQAIDDAMERALEGAGGLIVVEGLAGVGKSALLAQAVEHARTKDLSCLRAHADELESELALGVVLQMFEPAIAAADDDLLSGSAKLAAGLFRRGPALGTEGRRELLSLIHALYWVTSNLADRRPLLLVVDDVHWADVASLQFLHYLIQRVDQLGVAVLVGLRSGSPESQPDLMNRLATHSSATVLQLGPLSETATCKVVRDTFPEADDEFCAACSEVTDGNPLLLRQLLAAVKAEGMPRSAAFVNELRELTPQSVARSMAVRLGRLPEDAAKLLRAVAVGGEEQSLEFAAALADLPLHDAALAADELDAAEILLSGEPLKFVHPILRAAVYGNLGTAYRSDLHRRAATLLAADGAAPERIATHLLRAQPARDQAALASLQLAGREALDRGAPELAGRYLRRALSEAPPPEIRRDLLLELGRVETMVGEPRALDRLSQALTLVDDPEARASTLYELGRALHVKGRHGEANDAFERALKELPRDSDTHLRSSLLASNAIILLSEPPRRHRGTPDVSEWLQPALPTTLPADPALKANIAWARVLIGRSRDEVHALATGALEGGRLLRDETSDSPSFHAATRALGLTDDLDRETAELDAGLAEAASRGSVMAFASLSYLRGWPYYFKGRMEDCLLEVEQALEKRRYGWGIMAASASALLVHCLIELNDFDRAGRVVDSFDPTWDRHPVMWAYCLDARGRLRMLERRYSEALDDLLECGRVLDELGARNPMIIPWRSRAALAATGQDWEGDPRALIEQELSLARTYGAPRAIGIALTNGSQVVGGEEGIEMARQAIEELSSSPAALERARALVYLGRSLRRSGQRVAAREPLKEGLDLAFRSGARALTRRARKELLAVGVAPRREALSGIEALTSAERRTAAMAARGMTNRAIAEANFVTIKAVEWHLSRAYKKLGIKSRSALGGFHLSDDLPLSSSG